MLSSVMLTAYRTFRKLRVDGLSRVNLFVGKNNAGKTSLLDAIELLVLGNAWALFRSSMRRGEEAPSIDEEERQMVRRDLAISHQFFGHVIEGAHFSISGTPGPKSVTCQIIEVTSERSVAEPDLFGLAQLGPSLAISFLSGSSPGPVVLPLLPTGAISSEARRRISLAPVESSAAANFLRPESIETPRLNALWDSIALKPEENKVVEALQIIEPSIERIAFLGERRLRRGVFLKLRDSDQRLPIGNVGDGLKRLLALSLNLIAARGGYLFVDEIDTGLHFTVMENMWRLVIETAKALDVQVFATTHSLDCVNSLASVHGDRQISEIDVALHRIERDLDHTVRYSVQEITVAARRHVEMR
ncbi:MAG TPA: ATP-binding protein [Methylomirabilota bacterium]|jgi:hypothetical protein|nr:ATP-binding protein [Methylomirabilota bacterium]